MRDIRALLAFDAEAAASEALIVHCHGGISRSTAALALLLAKRDPSATDAIFETIRAIRPESWPNSHMIRLGDELLGRGGALVEALRRHYDLQATLVPWLSQAMTEGRPDELGFVDRGEATV